MNPVNWVRLTYFLVCDQLVIIQSINDFNRVATNMLD